jgi:hypothetical protein
MSIWSTPPGPHLEARAFHGRLGSRTPRGRRRHDRTRDAALRSVRLAREGGVGALMKGSLHTDELMSAVIHKGTGLRGSTRISHAFVFDLPRYSKLLALADCVVDISPHVPAKRDRLAADPGADRPHLACRFAASADRFGGAGDDRGAGRDVRRSPSRRRAVIERPVFARSTEVGLPGQGSGSFPGILACQYHFAARRSSPCCLERPNGKKETS